MTRRTVWQILCTLSVRAGLHPEAWITMSAVEWRQLTRGRPN
jgi:hypothetical protein